MADAFSVENDGPGPEYVEIPLDRMLVVLLQQLHDVVAELITDLGERGVIDPDAYFSDDAIVFEVDHTQ